MRGLVVGSLVTTFALAVGAPAAASDANAQAASPSSSLASINEGRVDRGLASLQVLEQLRQAAQRHAFRMAERHEIFHNRNLGNEIDGWANLGENVGVGQSASTVDEAFWGSTPHRRNMLGDYTVVGVGVVDDGVEVYVVHVFATMRRAPARTAEASSDRPSAPRKIAPSKAPAPPVARRPSRAAHEPARARNTVLPARAVTAADVQPVSASIPERPPVRRRPSEPVVVDFADRLSDTLTSAIQEAAEALSSWLQADALPLRA